MGDQQHAPAHAFRAGQRIHRHEPYADAIGHDRGKQRNDTAKEGFCPIRSRNGRLTWLYRQQNGPCGRGKSAAYPQRPLADGHGPITERRKKMGCFPVGYGKKQAAEKKKKNQVRQKPGKPWNGVMLGYRQENGKYIVVTEEAEIVRRIYSEYLAGHGINKIVNGLNADGVLTQKGYAWRTQGAVHPKIHRRIHRNRMYMFLRPGCRSDHQRSQLWKLDPSQQHFIRGMVPDPGFRACVHLSSAQAPRPQVGAYLHEYAQDTSRS